MSERSPKSLTKLNRMYNIKTTKQNSYQRAAKCTDDSPESEQLFNQIDQHICSLLVRASQIDSKLSKIESRSSINDDSSNDDSEDHEETEVHPINTPVKRTTQIKPSELASLVKAVKNLTEEIQLMKQDQQKMNRDIIELQGAMNRSIDDSEY